MSTQIALAKYLQTPDENKRYSIDYTDWLDVGETVITAAAEINDVTDPEFVASSLANSSTVVTFFLAGGLVGETYTVIIRTTTSTGQIKEDAIKVQIRDY